LLAFEATDNSMLFGHPHLYPTEGLAQSNRVPQLFATSKHA